LRLLKRRSPRRVVVFLEFAGKAAVATAGVPVATAWGAVAMEGEGEWAVAFPGEGEVVVSQTWEVKRTRKKLTQITHIFVFFFLGLDFNVGGHKHCVDFNFVLRRRQQ
jgi:hypothetical protein